MERLHVLEQRVASMEAERAVTDAAQAAAKAALRAEPQDHDAAIDRFVAPDAPRNQPAGAAYWRKRAYDAQADATRAQNEVAALRARIQRAEAALRGDAP